jgi:hypothetical protein
VTAMRLGGERLSPIDADPMHGLPSVAKHRVADRGLSPDSAAAECPLSLILSGNYQAVPASAWPGSLPLSATRFWQFSVEKSPTGRLGFSRVGNIRTRGRRRIETLMSCDASGLSRLVGYD